MSATDPMPRPDADPLPPKGCEPGFALPRDQALALYRLVADQLEGRPFDAAAARRALIDIARYGQELRELGWRYQEAASAYGQDGEIEVDDGAVVSLGEDPGAYVQAWLWIPDSEIEPGGDSAHGRLARQQALWPKRRGGRPGTVAGPVRTADEPRADL